MAVVALTLLAEGGEGAIRRTAKPNHDGPYMFGFRTKTQHRKETRGDKGDGNLLRDISFTSY